MYSRALKHLSHIWLMLWLVALPLVHVHPEADHAHGAQHHRHGGLVHSVLSQDLTCEFHQHSPSEHSAMLEPSPDDWTCEHTATHQLTHEEIDFSLLVPSPEDMSPIDEPHVALIPTAHSMTVVANSRELWRKPDHSPTLPIPITLRSTRAPPDAFSEF
ncbi:MAG: hypothetical protein MRJ96_13770 [Nitrospirales bacterium]|nr:hypothetical protein [Nitrospirales bacterium]